MAGTWLAFDFCSAKTLHQKGALLLRMQVGGPGNNVEHLLVAVDVPSLAVTIDWTWLLHLSNPCSILPGAELEGLGRKKRQEEKKKQWNTLPGKNKKKREIKIGKRMGRKWSELVLGRIVLGICNFSGTVPIYFS